MKQKSEGQFITIFLIGIIFPDHKLKTMISNRTYNTNVQLKKYTR